MYQGLFEAVISVSDAERIAEVYRSLGGWRDEALPDAPPEQAIAWGLDPGVRISQRRLLPPGQDHQGLRLVTFHGIAQQQMRPSAKIWDSGGLFDLDHLVDDVACVTRELLARGWVGFGDPTPYGWAGFHVTQVVLAGPDGLVLGLIEPKDGGPPGFSPMLNAAMTVRDYDAGIRFFTEGLGWQHFVDTRVEGMDEPGHQVLGLPMPMARDVLRRVGIVHPEGVNDGSLELIHVEGVSGRDFAPRCKAPNLGILTHRFPVADVEAMAADLSAKGIALDPAPIDLEIAGIGAVRLIACHTPEGARLEFFATG